MEQLIIQFIGYDLMSNVLGGIGDNLKNLGTQGDAAGSRLNQTLNSIAKTSTQLAIGFGVVFSVFGAGVIFAVKAAAEFDQAVLRLYTHGGQAQDQQQAMKNGLLDLSSATGISAVELANAAYFVTSYGIGIHDAAQALAVETVAAKTAAMTGADLTTVQSTLSAMLVAGLLPMNNLTQAAGELNAAISGGALTADQLSAALHTGLIPAAVNAGVSFADMGAAIDILTRGGFSASTATTALRNELIRFSAGGPAAEKALQSIGLSHAALTAELAKGDLIGTLQLLKDHLAGLSTVQQENIIYKVFGGTRGTSAVQSMLQNLGEMPALINSINAGGSEFNAQWTAYTQTVAYQVKDLGTNFHNLKIAIGEALGPAVVAALIPFNAFLVTARQWIQANPTIVSHIIEMILKITGLGAAIFGTISIISRLIILMESPFALAVTAIVLGLYWIVQHFDQISQVAGPVISTLVSGFNTIASAIGDLVAAFSYIQFGTAFSGLLTSLGEIGQSLTGNFINPVYKIVEFIQGPLTTAALQFGQAIITYIFPALNNLAAVIQANVVPIVQTLVSWFVDHLLPAIMLLVGWMMQNLPQALGAIINIFANVVQAVSPLVAALVAIGTTIFNILMPAVAWIISVVGGAVIGILQVLGNNFWIVDLAVSAVVARLIVLRAIGLYAWIYDAATALTAKLISALWATGQMFDGLGGKIVAVITGNSAFAASNVAVATSATAASAGVATATTALGEEAAAATAAIGPTEAESLALDNMVPIIGTVIAIMGVLTLGIVSFTSNTQQATDAAKLHDQAIQNLGANQQTFNGILAGQQNPILDVRDALNKAASATDTFTAAFHRSGMTVPQDLKSWSTQIKPIADNFMSMDHAAQAVVSNLLNDLPDLTLFYKTWQSNGHDTEAALGLLSDKFGKLWRDMIPQAQAAESQIAVIDQQIVSKYQQMVNEMSGGAVGAWDTIVNAYGAGSVQAQTALHMLSLPQQDVIRDLGYIADQANKSIDTIQGLGAQGTLDAVIKLDGKLIHVHGTTADVVQQIDAAVGALPGLGPTSALDQLNGQLLTTGQDISLLPTAMQGWVTTTMNQIDTVAGKWRFLQQVMNAVTPGPPLPKPPRPGVYKMAAGGPVDPMQAYIVGERGPELFQPSVSGTIIPNHLLASATSRASGGDGGGDSGSSEHMRDLVNISRRQLAVMEQETSAAPTPSNFSSMLYKATAHSAISRRRGIRT